MEARGVALMLAALMLLLAVPASAETTYFAVNPDTEFCITVVFGENGQGDYTITVDDPGYPGNGWVDTHFTSFTSGPLNPVINPVCFNTMNRKIGEEGLVTFRVETPEGAVSHSYGICVSDYADADFTEVDDDPCGATIAHTDLFIIDFVEPERYTVPGEVATFRLTLSSEFDLEISLDKVSGPQMEISETVISAPTEQTVDIVMTSPDEEGDYPFTISATAADCDYDSCEKSVSGVLHVNEEPGLEGFKVELSPKTKSVFGVEASSFFLTIHNFEREQEFTVSVKVDDSLQTDFSPRTVTIEKDKSRQLQFTVIPKKAEHKLSMLTAVVQGEIGGKRTAESFLVVEEPVAEVMRAAESDPELEEVAEEYTESYRTTPTLEDWKDMKEATTEGQEETNGGLTPPSEPDSSLMTWLAIGVVVFVVAAIVVFIYKKVIVTRAADQAISGGY
jgi:hypothetical protein